MHVYLILFSAIGLFLIGLAIPLIRRRVKPNPLYGLRIKATFADEWVWYEANARSGRDLATLGAMQLAAAVVLNLLPISETQYALSNAAILLMGTIVFCIVGCRRANTLLESRPRIFPLQHNN